MKVWPRPFVLREPSKGRFPLRTTTNRACTGELQDVRVIRWSCASSGRTFFVCRYCYSVFFGWLRPVRASSLGEDIVSRSSSREVGIRVPTFFCSLF